MTLKDEAIEFFRQLREFSARYFAWARMPAESPWGSGAFANGAPAGAIIHFTADDDFLRVLRWFQLEKYQSQASAHFVVADRKLGSAALFTAGLPLIEALPVTVIQCKSLSTVAWHATWVNNICLGIENINVGEVRKRVDDKWAWCGSEWTAPYGSYMQPEPVVLYGKTWAPFPIQQVETNLAILKHLRNLCNWRDGSRILGHEQVQSARTRMGGVVLHEKSDPGPAYPLNAVREAVFDDDTAFLEFVNGDAQYGEHSRDHYMVQMCGLLGQGGGTAIDRAVARTAFSALMGALPSQGGLRLGPAGLQSVWLCQCALKILGYHVALMNNAVMEGYSLQVFQKMMGLPGLADGVQVAQALVDRLKERGFIS